MGKLITKKSDRITAKNRNRGKLWALHRKFEKTDPAKSARILEKNLSRKAENPRQLKEEGLSKRGFERFYVCQSLGVLPNS